MASMYIIVTYVKAITLTSLTRYAYGLIESMFRGSPQSEIDRHAYIPPDVQNTLNQHFNQSVPAHLRQYVGSNNTGYIPRGMEQAISKEMKSSLPPHLQQYADAYVQQSIVQPVV